MLGRSLVCSLCGCEDSGSHIVWPHLPACPPVSCWNSCHQHDNIANTYTDTTTTITTTIIIITYTYRYTDHTHIAQVEIEKWSVVSLVKIVTEVLPSQVPPSHMFVETGGGGASQASPLSLTLVEPPQQHQQHLNNNTNIHQHHHKYVMIWPVKWESNLFLVPPGTVSVQAVGCR